MADEKPDTTDPQAEGAKPAPDGEEKAAPKRRRARRTRAKDEAEPKVKPKAETKPKAEAKPKAEGKPKAEAKPKAKAKPTDGAEAKPEAKAEAAATPEPEAAEKPGAKDEPAEREPAVERRPAAQRDGSPARAPVVRARARYVRSSARKARLVCDHLRGRSVEEARAILAHTDRAVARDWSKLLESAVANAEHNHELDGDELRVLAVHADEGPTLKRFRPRAMGRATRIRKRTTHLTIALTPKE